MNIITDIFGFIDQAGNRKMFDTVKKSFTARDGKKITDAATLRYLVLDKYNDLMNKKDQSTPAV